MITPQYILDISDEIIVDNFAGGGGASTGIELALGRHVDVAINHDPEAVSMHQANHPQTVHHCESVWEVNPREVMPGRKIGLLWLSPDCKHFSKAKGGAPVEKSIRGLAWVALRWAATRQPRVIMLENVEEFITWGPLVEDAEGKLRPCPKNKGREFNSFANALRRQGYVVDWKELRACDYGTPTIRKRLFLIARRDGQPIVWPAPTHYDPAAKQYKGHKGKIYNTDGITMRPWHTAAECIDWSIPGNSIFLTPEQARKVGVKRPLADATMRRIAKGIMKYVVNSAKPFIVTTGYGEREGQSPRVPDINKPLGTVVAGSVKHALVTPFITEHANGSNQRNMPADGPLRTQCAQVKGGHFALVSAFISTYYGDKKPSDVRGIDMREPLHVQTTENRHAVVAASLVKNYTGAVGSDLNDPIGTITSVDHHSLLTAHIQRDMGKSIGHAADSPLATTTAGGGGKSALVTSNLIKMRGTNVGQETNEPLHTISAQGTHFAEVQAFLIKYYGTDQDPQLLDPLHTVTTKDRYGLVTIQGEKYAITDIYLRMLDPRELFNAQGFPTSYIIDRGLIIDQDGNILWRPLTKSAQVRMCGNSVCPPLAAALVRANCADMIAITERHRRTA